MVLGGTILVGGSACSDLKAGALRDGGVADGPRVAGDAVRSSDAPVQDYSVSATGPAIVHRGEHARIHIRVTRSAGFSAAISVSLDSAAAVGLVVATLTLANGSAEGDLELSASAMASVGTWPLEVVARAQGIERRAGFSLGIVPQMGAPDVAFGSGGEVRGRVFTGDFRPGTLGVEPDGAVLVGGLAQTSAPSCGDQNIGGFVLARFAASGAPDTRFGGGTVGFGGDGVYFSRLTRDAQGRPVALMFAQTTGNARTGLGFARWKTDGALDATFGDGGRHFADAGQNAKTENGTLAIDGAGRIVATGFLNGQGVNVPMAVRLLESGAPDPSFGTAGLVRLDEFLGRSAYTTQVAVARDEKIYLQTLSVIRLGTGGAIDPSFGTAGRLDLGFAATVLPNDDGTFLLVGSADSAHLVIERRRIDGSVDGTFAKVDIDLSARISSGLLFDRWVFDGPDRIVVLFFDTGVGQETKLVGQAYERSATGWQPVIGDSVPVAFPTGELHAGWAIVAGEGGPPKLVVVRYKNVGVLPACQKETIVRRHWL